METKVRILLFFTLLVAAAASAHAQATSVPIIVYHGIVNGSSSTEVRTSTFDTHMAALKNAGYTPIYISDYNDFLAGTKTLPAKPIIITFDDGRKDSFYNGDPILKKYGMKATMFTLSKWSTRTSGSYYMTKSEILQMKNTGRWEIQAHGYDAHQYFPISSSGATGPFLTSKLWLANKSRVETTDEYRARIARDFDLSKDLLESHFDVTVESFAYPFGQYGQNVVNYAGANTDIRNAADDRFKTTFYQTFEGEGFSYNLKENAGFLSKRIIVGNTWTGAQLIAALEEGKAKPSTYSDTLASDKGWQKMWGTLSVSSGALNLAPSSSSTSAATFLDGTGQWRNYRHEATLKSFTGQLTMYARMQNPDTHLSCTFNSGDARIYERRNGVVSQLASGKHSQGAVTAGDKTAIEVNGDTVKCLLNGEQIVTATSSGSLDYGGIGFKIWDPTTARARMQLEEIRVSAPGTTVPLPDPEPTPDPEPSPENPELPFSDPMITNLGWESYWGQATVQDGYLDLHVDGTTGASTFLPKTRDWSNYKVTADVKDFDGKYPSVVAHYVDGNNYVSCDFHPTMVVANLKRDGVFTRLAQRSHANGIPSLGDELFAEVDGSTVSCGMNGATVVSATSSALPAKGAIGMKVWDPENPAASFKVEEVTVVAS